MPNLGKLRAPPESWEYGLRGKSRGFWGWDAAYIWRKIGSLMECRRGLSLITANRFFEVLSDIVSATSSVVLVRTGLLAVFGMKMPGTSSSRRLGNTK